MPDTALVEEEIMFESAELGHSIDKATYRKEVPKLRASLLAYVASPAFKPDVELATSDIERLMCAEKKKKKGE